MLSTKTSLCNIWDNHPLLYSKTSSDRCHFTTNLGQYKFALQHWWKHWFSLNTDHILSLFYASNCVISYQFDSSMISAWLSFQQENLPLPIVKCLLSHFGQHSGRRWVAHQGLWVVRRQVSTTHTPLHKWRIKSW